ncbi:hypothetical protein NOS3756_32400 [Nostoc sp. NIES-3756]|uniref:hypothetical protein n=1 Tax=Nostoc sp. NIES-3756 TaxID=1751286 RepID=UPI00071FEDCB|nr:hypothetical protein [Nostoc sp. NIES-3756]BAT54273.1 hypothetical protein NOS3756_32400 [Nostoc sp. NIES-3756]BAY37986.1 hypothetical protein NIES2111_23290 [Nostoc sp. NIES-2111]
MNNIRLYSKVAPSQLPESSQQKLSDLLEWNKIVYGCLQSGQVEDAKIFLEQAITEAEKPVK